MSRLDELEELIIKIPTGKTDDDVKNINEYLAIAAKSNFQLPLTKFFKLNLTYCNQKLLEETISNFVANLQTSNQSLELFTFLFDKVDQEFLVKIFIKSEFINDTILPFLTSKKFKEENNSQFLSLSNLLIKSMLPFDDIPPYIRSLRQMIFQLAFHRRELQLCLDVIKSVNLCRSSSDFFEFSSYASSLIQLAADNEPIAHSLFEYMLNCSALYYKEPGFAIESWLISCLTSFAPLLYGKTVHPAVLDYAKYFLSIIDDNPIKKLENVNDSTVVKKSQNINKQNLKNIISKFEESSRPIYNASLPLNSAPSLLRPYYLHKLWSVNLFSLGEKSDVQPEQIYNYLLNLCHKCSKNLETQLESPGSKALLDLLAQLPPESSLPFYFLLAQRGYESEFNTFINNIFKNKNNNKNIIPKVLAVFEKAARTSPALLKPHFDSISAFKIEDCATICSLLIKSDIISFVRLWPFVKKLSFPDVKPIIREGIVQIQRRSRSFENGKFIIKILHNYFETPSSKNSIINWAAVSEVFYDDSRIASTMLLNEAVMNVQKDSQNDNATELLSWREQFIRYISRSPSTYHRIVVIPYLLLSTCDNNLQIEKVKWAVSKLPCYQNGAEAVLEGYSIFELSKHIISQAASMDESIKTLSEVFNFVPGKVTSYVSAFAHAAYAIQVGSTESLNALVSSIESDHLLTVYSSKLSINFLRLNNFIFEDKFKEVVQKVENPLVDRVFALLSPSAASSSSASNVDDKLDKSEREFIEMVIKAHSMNVESINKSIKKKEFSSFNEVRQHFLLLSISCFLLLPERSVSQSSTKKCVNLLNSPSSTYKQKNFALLALSQSPSILDENEIDYKSLVDDPNLHKSLLAIASKLKNIELITMILSKSKDFTILQSIKPLLQFLDQKMLSDFVEKTALGTDVDVLFDSLDLFQNTNILFIIYTDIRFRPIINTIVSNRYQKLRSSLSKFGPPESLEKFAFTPFDNFALLSMCQLDYPISSIVKGLLSEKCHVTLPGLFLILTSMKDKMPRFTECLFVSFQELESNEILKSLKFLSVFFLIYSSKEPFESLRLHFCANPEELNDDILDSLMPSLFARFISQTEYYEILLRVSEETDSPHLKEAVQILRLKPLK